MRILRDDQAREWVDHPSVKPWLDSPSLKLCAPRETTIYVEHEGFLAAFHPAPAWGVFFVHVAALPGVKAADAARQVLAFVAENFPQIETVIGMVDPKNRAVRAFARRIGFRTTATIQTKRGPRMLVELAQ